MTSRSSKFLIKISDPHVKIVTAEHFKATGSSNRLIYEMPPVINNCAQN
jgi:hypothetical protein